MFPLATTMERAALFLAMPRGCKPWLKMLAPSNVFPGLLAMRALAMQAPAQVAEFKQRNQTICIYVVICFSAHVVVSFFIAVYCVQLLSVVYLATIMWVLQISCERLDRKWSNKDFYVCDFTSTKCVVCDCLECWRLLSMWHLTFWKTPRTVHFMLSDCFITLLTARSGYFSTYP